MSKKPAKKASAPKTPKPAAKKPAAKKPARKAAPKKAAKAPAAAPSHETIAILARDLWEQEGRPQNRDTEIWLEAERRLSAK